MMIGALVGVGVFGIPYAFAQSGFIIGLLELIGIGALLIISEFMFAELALQTDGNHRLIGYIGVYLGGFWKDVSTAAVCVSTWGGMIAYMIIGGKFLHWLLGGVFGGTFEWYAMALTLAVGMFVYRGVKMAAHLEVFVMSALIFLFVFVILLCVPQIQVSHLQTFDWKHVFTPYGVMVFALSSIGIVPELKALLGARAKKDLGHIILLGMSIVIVLYALFALAVVGVTGAGTTPVAFDGLIHVFGTPFRIITTLLGSLTVFSIFVMVGIQLMDIIELDFSLPRRVSWSMTMIVPVVCFLFGLQEFIRLIGFIGGVFGGFLGIMIAWAYLRMKRSPVCTKKHCLNFPNVLSVCVILLFLGGMFLEVYALLV